MTGPTASAPGTTAGPWTVLARSARVWVPTVVIGAAVQAATVLPGATPGPGIGFVLLAVSSLAVTVATLACLAAAVLRAASRSPRRRDLALWAGGVGVIGAAAAVIVPPAVPLVLLGGTWSLPTGEGLRVFRAAPVRAVLASVGTLVVAVVGWLVAFLVGFFVTGALAAGLVWLLIGVLAAVVLAGWSALHRRADDRATAVGS